MENDFQLFPQTNGAADEALIDAVRNLITRAQPSGWELLEQVEKALGLKARWMATDALRHLVDDRSLTGLTRDYIRDLLNSADLAEALKGKQRPGKEIESSIDALVRESSTYRNSSAFQEMVSFMAKFREYAPYNNMLVRIQYPSCSFYATRNDWEQRFNRRLKEDARPMLILATMHPVMLVYDVDQTEGLFVPAELEKFAKFTGAWDIKRLSRTIENARDHDSIRVDFKQLSSTNGGFATIARGDHVHKMRIAIHEPLDGASRYGVLCHELAHIYLGHLGGDKDGWWPSRGDLSHNAMEIEAEAVAFIVTQRAGLSGSSHQYVSRHLKNLDVLASVSVDMIAKVAGRIERMAERMLSDRSSGGKVDEE